MINILQSMILTDGEKMLARLYHLDSTATALLRNSPKTVIAHASIALTIAAHNICDNSMSVKSVVALELR